MGAVCSVICGAAVVVLGVAVWADEWVDEDKRWMALAIGLVLGGGTILHQCGVW